MNYDKLIAHFGSPLDVAKYFKFARDNSGIRVKRNASSRVCMWRKQGIPMKYLKKLEQAGIN